MCWVEKSLEDEMEIRGRSEGGRSEGRGGWHVVLVRTLSCLLLATVTRTGGLLGVRETCLSTTHP